MAVRCDAKECSDKLDPSDYITYEGNHYHPACAIDLLEEIEARITSLQEKRQEIEDSLEGD